MGETIEAFIEKLQADGVEAGRAAAKKVRSEAEQQAQQIIADAEARAKQTLADAEAQCEKIRLRSETELKLAVRDAVVRLRETLVRSLDRVLAEGVRQQLKDAGFLQELLRDLVSRYVKADIEGTGEIRINVSKEMQQRLAQWAIETIRAEHDGHHRLVELHGSLLGAGFEYSISEGTTEITVQSVVNVLSDLVSAELREILADTASEDDSSQHSDGR
jgi:V/A-type H+-transporting ATPase subunit E